MTKIYRNTTDIQRDKPLNIYLDPVLFGENKIGRMIGRHVAGEDAETIVESEAENMRKHLEELKAAAQA